MSELNLLPYHIKQKKLMKLNLIQVSLVSVIIVAVLVAGIFVPYTMLEKLRNEEASIKIAVEKERPVKVENERLKKEIASKQEYVDKVEEVKKTKYNVQPSVKGLEKYLPTDVAIISLSFNSGNITISATSKSYKSITEFLANLQESKEYSNSTVGPITNNETAKEFTFSITISEVKGEVK